MKGLRDLNLVLLFVILSGIFSTSHCIAQETRNNRIDSIGRKQGFWKKYNDEGLLKYEGNFKDNVPVGEFKYYYPTGKIKAISRFSDHGKKSFTTTFHPNGVTIMAEGKYINELKDSIWTYFDENKILISQEIYLNGQKNGPTKNYFNGSKVIEITNYKNGVKHGEWIRYYGDGNFKSKSVYENDLIQGLSQYFYPSGKVMVSGIYKNSVKDGIWMYFDEIGKTQKKETYKDGHLIKEEIFDKSIIEKENYDSLPPDKAR
jgi:antitoxin component YwqK of YwqJK toxin-antitoxin module